MELMENSDEKEKEFFLYVELYMTDVVLQKIEKKKELLDSLLSIAIDCTYMIRKGVLDGNDVVSLDFYITNDSKKRCMEDYYLLKEILKMVYEKQEVHEYGVKYVDKPYRHEDYYFNIFDNIVTNADVVWDAILEKRREENRKKNRRKRKKKDSDGKERREKSDGVGE